MMLEKAKTAWGLMPDWIEALALACDGDSLRKIAKKLKLSPAIISLALANKRKNLNFIKTRVEAVLMLSIIHCSVLGMIDKKQCVKWQMQEFSSANPMKVQMYRACRCCEYSKIK